MVFAIPVCPRRRFLWRFLTTRQVVRQPFIFLIGTAAVSNFQNLLSYITTNSVNIFLQPIPLNSSSNPAKIVYSALVYQLHQHTPSFSTMLDLILHAYLLVPIFFSRSQTHNSHLAELYATLPSLT